MSISLICACKNRNEALKVSLNSWLNYKEIEEFIIVDWSSDESLEHLTSLDSRIKIIRVEGQKYFNQPQPLNLALSQATGEYIIKVDCDYVLSPYYSFFEKYKVDDNSFVSGKASYKSPEFYNESTQSYLIDRTKMTMEELCDYHNTYSSYYKFLTGLLYISKENLLKVNGYNENLSEHYSYEDDEIYKRLELLGLEHKKLDYDYHVFHIPHPDTKRFENFKSFTEEPNLRNDLITLLSQKYSGQELEWQVDYVLAMKHNKRNIEKSGEITNYYDDTQTNWMIDKKYDNYYLAKIVDDTVTDRLKNFPPVHFISVDHSEERRKNLYEKFKLFHVENITPHIFKKYSDDDHTIISNYLEVNGDYRLSQGCRGPVTSHLKAIKEWLNTTNEEYAFFCEDDLSLETVQYWNFTWEEFVDVLPPKWDCIQLCIIQGIEFDIEFRNRCWGDWSACAYLIKREYAQKLIDTYHHNENFYLDVKCHDAQYRPDWALVPVVETTLFSLTNRVYVFPLFVEDTSFKSSYAIENVTSDLDNDHNMSYNTVINWWKEMGFNLSSNKIITNKIKLLDFPSVNYISLDESVERRESLRSQFFHCGVDGTRGLISRRFKDSDDKVYGEQLHILDDGTIGCVVSHIKMIKKWYEETNEDYAFFCEDDLSLETVQYWNFTWNDFVQSLPEDAECVQLCCIKTNYGEIKLKERSMYDWSVTAYILTRDYARKIIERYCDGDSYRLEISGTNFYPMPENVLFYGLGKVYSVNLFVEDQNLTSTFYGHTDLQSENKEYHQETYRYVIDWWKNNSNLKLSEIVSDFLPTQLAITEPQNNVSTSGVKTELEILLTEYSLDPENPQNSFNVGLWYEKEGHTAPALSYFLRSAERFEDENMIYESLIKCHHCYDKQGTRDGTAISLLQQALCIMPNRPEAYFLLARFHEKRHQWSDCYKYSSLGLSISDFSSEKTSTDIEYPGKCGLLFQKALSGWYWGKVEESKNIFVDISTDPDLPKDIYNIVVDNLKNFDIHIEKKN